MGTPSLGHSVAIPVGDITVGVQGFLQQCTHLAPGVGREHPARGKDARQQLPASLVRSSGHGSGEWTQSSSLYGMEGVPLGTGCQPNVCEGTVIRLKLISKVDCS